MSGGLSNKTPWLCRGVSARACSGGSTGVFTSVSTLLPARHQRAGLERHGKNGRARMAKGISYTKPSLRKIKSKSGLMKTVFVKPHANKLNVNRKTKKR
jgi:hypothetical protein